MLSHFNIRVGDHLTDHADVDVTVERVQQGGLGIVAMGPDRGIDGRWAALKAIRPDRLPTSPTARKRVEDRFVGEGLTWLGLWPHPNLLTAITVTRIWEQPFLVLDYAERGSLRSMLETGDLSLDAGLLWAQMIAAGLDALHTPDPDHLRDVSIVHRDLKPENVLVRTGYLLQITDFGLAKVVDAASVAPGVPEDEPAPEPAPLTRARLQQTEHGQAFGTAAYMAPEQWTDAASVGPPADVYAFGIMLSELLAGRHALLDLDRPHSAAAWREAHFTGTPRPLRAVRPDLPEALEDLYRRCMSKQPEVRPSAHEALTLLQGIARAAGKEAYVPQEICLRTPENELAHWFNLASAHWRFRLFDDALTLDDRALAIAPHDPAALLLRGTIRIEQGRPEEGLTAIDAALAAMPADDRRRKTILNQRGIALRSARRYEEAEAAYAQALALDGEYADCWANRALNQGTWGDDEMAAGHWAEARVHYEQAIADVDRAIAIDPHTPQHPRLRAAMRRGIAEMWFFQGRDVWQLAEGELAVGHREAARPLIEQAIACVRQAIASHDGDQRYHMLLEVLRRRMAGLGT